MLVHIRKKDRLFETVSVKRRARLFRYSQILLVNLSWTAMGVVLLGEYFMKKAANWNDCLLKLFALHVAWLDGLGILTAALVQTNSRNREGRTPPGPN